MEEFLGRPYPDGSFWKTNFQCVNPDPCPTEGILKIDLRMNRTSLVVSVDEEGICRESEEYEVRPILFRSQQFPGTMGPADYYNRLRNWLLCSLPLDHHPLETNLVHEFMDRVVGFVLGKINSRDQKLAIHVKADLSLVSIDTVPFAALPPELFEFDDQDLEQNQIDETTMISEADDEDVPARQLGLSEDTIRELMEHYSFDAADVGEEQSLGDCSICLEDLVSGVEDTMMMMLFESPCCHVFHFSCIDKWLRSNYSCPLCRFIIPSEIYQVLEDQ